MAEKKIIIRLHRTKDAEEKDPRIVSAKRATEDAIANAITKTTALIGVLKDREDKSQADSARRFLKDALGKIELEVLSG